MSEIIFSTVEIETNTTLPSCLQFVLTLSHDHLSWMNSSRLKVLIPFIPFRALRPCLTSALFSYVIFTNTELENSNKSGQIFITDTVISRKQLSEEKSLQQPLSGQKKLSYIYVTEQLRHVTNMWQILENIEILLTLKWLFISVCIWFYSPQCSDAQNGL